MNFKKQKPQTIYNFKKGDYITRVIPGRPSSNGFDNTYEFIGEKLKFVGILNGSIYLEKYMGNLNEVFSFIFGQPKNSKDSKESKSTTIINIPLDLWEDGWAKFIDPNKEFGLDSKTSIYSSQESNEIESLKIKLNNAIEEDEYEEAETVKKKIEKLKKKINKQSKNDKNKS